MNELIKIYSSHPLKNRLCQVLIFFCTFFSKKAKLQICRFFSSLIPSRQACDQGLNRLPRIHPKTLPLTQIHGRHPLWTLQKSYKWQKYFSIWCVKQCVCLYYTTSADCWLLYVHFLISFEGSECYKYQQSDVWQGSMWWILMLREYNTN